MRNLHIALLAFSTFASVSSIEWTDLRTTWLPTASPGLNSYYQIPRTACDAVSQGWVPVDGINDLQVTPYCLPNDVRYCVLLDGYGHVAGVQTGILVSDTEATQEYYNLSNIDTVKRKQFFGQDAWTSTFYTVDPEIIEAGGREEWNNLTGTGGAWLETKEGYIVIARSTKDLDPIWTRALCFDQMGTHFYYNGSKAEICQTLNSHFLMYENEELHSVGWLMVGSKPIIEERPWFENMPVQLIELINPIGPQCLYDGVQEFGILTLHTYFIPEPWKVKCPMIGEDVRDELMKNVPKRNQEI